MTRLVSREVAGKTVGLSRSVVLMTVGLAAALGCGRGGDRGAASLSGGAAPVCAATIERGAGGGDVYRDWLGLWQGVRGEAGGPAPTR